MFMRPIKIVKLGTRINFLSKTKLFVSLSLIFIISSIFLLFARGLNFGIDYQLNSKTNINLNVFNNSTQNLIDVQVIANKTNGQNIFSYLMMLI